jgi:hypothetical protein
MTACFSEGLTSRQGPKQPKFTLWRVLFAGIQRRVVLSKRLLIANVLHGVMTQKIEFFMNTAVTTPNPSKYTLYYSITQARGADGTVFRFLNNF